MCRSPFRVAAAAVVRFRSELVVSVIGMLIGDVDGAFVVSSLSVLPNPLLPRSDVASESTIVVDGVDTFSRMI